MPPVVCISPGLSLTLRFDTPLRPESVKTQERERFEEVNPGDKTLTLVPPEKLVAGERFTLEVCFADGAAPACATFLLLAHPALGMSQVKVFRKPRPVESFQEGEKAAQAEDLRQCQEEVRQLRAERGVPDGLQGRTGLGVADEGAHGLQGLIAQRHRGEGQCARPMRCIHSYRAGGRVAVEVYLENPGAAALDGGGRGAARAQGRGVEATAPLAAGARPSASEPGADGQEPERRVVVEVLASEAEARGTYTLTLWDADQQRTVTLGNVTFP